MIVAMDGVTYILINEHIHFETFLEQLLQMIDSGHLQNTCSSTQVNEPRVESSFQT